MATDISAIDSTKPINNIYIHCTTLITANIYKPRYLSKANYISNLTIESIENKFDDRFDDPSYYYGIGNATIVGG